MLKQHLLTLFGTGHVEELTVVVEAVLQAAKLCEAIAAERTDRAITKADASPVTIADYGSQLLICDAIRRVHPTVPIIAEEDISCLPLEQAVILERIMDRSISDFDARLHNQDCCENMDSFWTIDPIDGTKGYLRGDQYSNCVSLVMKEQVVLSVIGCPRLRPFGGDGEEGQGRSERGTLFVAVKDHGAYEIDPASLVSATPVCRKLPLSPAASLQTSILTEGFEASHADHAFSARFAQTVGIDVAKTIRMDSQCKYGLVARAQANVYLRRATKRDYRENIWDHAPGSLLVEEAGGVVTDLTGRRIRYQPKAQLDAQGGLLVSNMQDPHEDLIAVLATMQ